MEESTVEPFATRNTEIVTKDARPTPTTKMISMLAALMIFLIACNNPDASQAQSTSTTQDTDTVRYAAARVGSAEQGVDAIPVFPGAQGFGVETPAGRGGKIVRVTNLDDDGQGSFRAALRVPGRKTILFEVGGTVNLSADLDISDPFVTVAGQSAPSPGITLRGAGLRVFSHDALVQHIRIRVGDAYEGPDPEIRDAFQVLGPNAYNVVIDHVSASWGIDETTSTWYPLHDVTISNCIISEGLSVSLHPEGAHSAGLLVGDGSQRIAVIGNLMAHNNDRNPLLKGSTSTIVLNNLVYNPGYRSIRISDPEDSGPTIASIVGNVLRTGPSTENDYLVSFSATVKQGTQVYLLDNSARTQVHMSRRPGFEPIVDVAPIWIPTLEVRPSGEVTDWVLANAGARPTDRDAVDERIVRDVLDSRGRIIDSQNDVGGWPALQPTRRPLQVPDDPGGDSDGDGYTNLEEWLHELAAALEAAPTR
jgi:hypothetical protein